MNALKPVIKLLIIVTICLSNIPVHANSVERIEIYDFDSLMKEKNSQCLVVAMASWCVPCRKELPALVKLYNKYKAQGLKMIGMGLDLEGPSVLQPIVDKFNVSFPIYWIGEKGIEKYKITAVPIIFFIKDGIIIEKIAGNRSEEFLDKKIADFLK